MMFAACDDADEYCPKGCPHRKRHGWEFGCNMNTCYRPKAPRGKEMITHRCKQEPHREAGEVGHE